MTSRTQLPEPSFIDRDADVLVRDYITLYEQVTGKVLEPAQPERLFIDMVAYREYLLRVEIQKTAMQCLVNYATGYALDHLGIRLGVTRLPAAAARTTVRFTLVSEQTVNILIPVGTQIRTKDSKFTFATDVSAVIEAGAVYVDVSAVCTEAGQEGNGYIAGDINTMLSTLPYMQSAVNISASYGGSDEESDDHLADRIINAPESFSVAGPAGAYRFWAKTAHPDIIDVGITSPSDAVVYVYPMTSGGAPSAEIISLVESLLGVGNDRSDIRPLTDKVAVFPPTIVEYSVEVNVTVYTTADADSVKKLIDSAIDAYAVEMMSALGMDIVKSQLHGRIMSVYGVYDAVLTIKDGSGNVISVKSLDKSQYASMTSKTVNITGDADG